MRRFSEITLTIFGFVLLCLPHYFHVMTRILLADDNEDTVAVMKLIIDGQTDNAHEVVEVYNGHDAIAEIRRAESAKVFGLVITDFEMGQGPDGVDVATEAIRNNIAHVFINTSFQQGDSTYAGSKLADAMKKYGNMNVVPKMDYDGLQKHIFPLLAEEEPIRLKK